MKRKALSRSRRCADLGCVAGWQEHEGVQLLQLMETSKGRLLLPNLFMAADLCV